MKLLPFDKDGARPAPSSASPELSSGDAVAGYDPGEFARNIMDAASEYGRMVTAFSKAHQSAGDKVAMLTQDPLGIGKAFYDVMRGLHRDPHALMASYTKYVTDSMRLWQNTILAFWGVKGDPVVKQAKGDKRFRDDAWESLVVFDFIRQSYLLTSHWLHNALTSVEGVEETTLRKVDFFTKQFIDALSPANFAFSNPEVLRATLRSNGRNLVDGLRNLLTDLERGDGELLLTHSDLNAFEVGRDMAATPGKVVFRNELLELIQYAPATETVYRRPVLVVPAWINKYYILDMRGDNSFVRWLVGRGYTVFIISWVNPRAGVERRSLEDYMRSGVMAAMDAVEAETGERELGLVGYCIGGTLAAVTLAALAARSDDRVASATLFTTLTDFTDTGDLSIFIDDEIADLVEQQTHAAGGVLKGSTLYRTFNSLRANDLWWSFVIDNYLLGKAPAPFDMLFWNADSTNLPAAMHLEIIRKLYQGNQLAQGELVIGDTSLDLGRVKTPIFLQASREDHIAPAVAVYKGKRLFGGPVEFVLAGSGHIAGVINPPSAKRYKYWTGGDGETLEEWLGTASEHPGSWWPYLDNWLAGHSGEMVPARQPGDGLADAPGSYVMEKAD